MSNQKNIDRISRESGLGSLSRALTDTLYGINHRRVSNPVPINTDNHGLTFFTRPMLNLSYDNIAASRLLHPLLTDDQYTLARYVRATLDFQGQLEGVTTPLVDPKMAFIPLLTNSLISISGWPDMVVDTFTSQEGIYKEAYSQVDGVSRIFTTYDLTANFRNLAGDPITFLFMVWIHYASQVYEGRMMPRREMIVQNRIDYNTRIYRLVLDQTQTYVQKIAACGAAFPMATPLGGAFNYSSDEPFNHDNDQISVPFRCMGADYQDPVLVHEFNAVVAMFNKSMATVGQKGNNYHKLTPAERNYFKNTGYPRINPETYELEWWVPGDVYNELLNEGA